MSNYGNLPTNVNKGLFDLFWSIYDHAHVPNNECMALVVKLNRWLGLCYNYHILERGKWGTFTTQNTTLYEIPHWSRLREGIFHSLGSSNGFTMQQCEGDKFWFSYNQECVSFMNASFT